MSFVRWLTDSVVGAVVRWRARIEADPSAQVRWTALRGTRGGRVKIGEGSIVNCRIAFDAPDGKVEIGRRCYIGASLLVCHSSICIEDDVIISWGVTMVDHDSHALEWSGRARDVADWREGRKSWGQVSIKPVHIEEKVWIGFGVSILKGVRIGKGAVVGAGSVLTRDVPPYTVVAGNPARVIRQLPSGGDGANTDMAGVPNEN